MKFFLTYCSLLLAAVAFFKQGKDLKARLLTGAVLGKNQSLMCKAMIFP
jgi:hypothetical protein